MLSENWIARHAQHFRLHHHLLLLFTATYVLAPSLSLHGETLLCAWPLVTDITCHAGASSRIATRRMTSVADLHLHPHPCTSFSLTSPPPLSPHTPTMNSPPNNVCGLRSKLTRKRISEDEGQEVKMQRAAQRIEAQLRFSPSSNASSQSLRERRVRAHAPRDLPNTMEWAEKKRQAECT